MKPATLTKVNFTAEISKGVTLVDFWASWCGPCSRMAPAIDELAEEMTDVKFGKVDVDEQAELSDMYRIEVMPTLMVFKDGQAIDAVSGVIPKSDLKAMIEKASV